jgi:hypothetical protein
VTRLLNRHRGEAPRATGRKMMRRADDVMLHVRALTDACPAAGVRGRGYAMLPHEVRVPVARDGCDVDFTSSLGGSRCAPCTGYRVSSRGSRIRRMIGNVCRSYVASLQTFSSRLSGRHRLSRVIRSMESDVTLGDPRATHGAKIMAQRAAGFFRMMGETLAAHTKQSQACRARCREPPGR